MGHNHRRDEVIMRATEGAEQKKPPNIHLMIGGCVWGGGGWTAKTVKRPRQQPARPQYANYWAPLTRKRHTMPHSAQPQDTNYWAPRTRKRHQQEHRPQRPTESSDPTQHAKGRTGDCPGPRKGATTRRNVTQGGGVMAGHREGGQSSQHPILAHPPPTCAKQRTDRGHACVPICAPPFPHFCLFLAKELFLKHLKHLAASPSDARRVQAFA